MIQSRLVLQSGEIFEGFSPDWQEGNYFGEAVFTTGMTGYVESLTDPSFAGQLLTFTYPIIGNYGVPPREEWESYKVHANGVILSDLSHSLSHFQANQSLQEFLQKEKVPLIAGVDTRRLTKLLRTGGAALGAICHGKKSPLEFSNPNLTPLIEQASIDEPQMVGQGAKKIVLVDCGMKESILRSLLRFSLTITRVPATYDYTQMEYDGIFISNGPGDPALCEKTIGILKKSMRQKKPTFGICLGAQIMALSIGATTYKLPYGHRGHNQPCLDTRTGRCYLTSQNHGYAITESSLPEEWKVSYRNLNDGSVEGIEHNSLPFFSVQFHPEAAPGPVDTTFLFKKFYDAL